MRCRLLSLFSFLLFVAVPPAALGAEPHVPRTTEELKRTIDKIMAETHVPGVSVVIVSKENVLWQEQFGLANVASGRKVAPETMFRAGSISKSFTALAILKLVEEGKVKLEDKVRDLVPEVAFTNPWEEVEPLRLVHLMEHTSGFSDISLREYATMAPASDMRTSVMFDPKPRTSRWRPGRFFSYSNANYTLTGYIVEKVSGKSFDDYLDETLFQPLGLKTASFLRTDSVRQYLAAGYDTDGKTELPYGEMPGRSTGALNISPGELAVFVQMLLNRGVHQGKVIFQPETIIRVETPNTELSARNGMKAGYGLANYSQTYKGFHFRGHSGALGNYLATYAYSVEHDLGFVLMNNTGGREPHKKISDAVFAYLTRSLPIPTIPEVPLTDEQLKVHAGFYEPITPRHPIAHGLGRLLGLEHVGVDNGKLKVLALGEPITLVPANESGLMYDAKNPVANLLFVEDEGEYLAVSGQLGIDNHRRISAWLAWLEIGLTIFCIVMMLSSVLFVLIWLPRKLFGRMKGVRHWSVRLYPLLAILFLVAMHGVFILINPANVLNLLGNRTWLSIGIYALSWLFALFAALGLVQAIRARNWEVNRWMRRHSLLVSIANVIVAGYLAYWGLIGIQTWQ